MSGLSAGFVSDFLFGFLTNLWVGAASLVVGTLIGAPLAWLRHRSGWLSRAAATVTALLRGAPTFVVMFFLLNVLPQDLTLFGWSLTFPSVAILVLALAIYAAAYVSDNLLDTLRYLASGSTSNALLIVPKMLRAFFVLVMASSVGAAIGVQEAVTTTLRQTDRLPTVEGRIALVIGVILFFTCVMLLARTGAQFLSAILTTTVAGRKSRVSDDDAPRVFIAHSSTRLMTQYGWVMALGIALIGTVAFIAPLPPKQITIETGPVDGSWYQIAEKYRDYLQGRGVKVKLVPRDDSLSIIGDVNQAESDVDVGFVIHSVKPQQYPDVATLGSIEYQPMFVLVRSTAGQVPTLAALRGLRIAFPPQSSATTAAAMSLLPAFGVTAENSQLSFQPLADQVKMLTSGEADAAFIMLDADSPLIGDLARHEDLRILNVPQAAAISHQFPMFRDVILPTATYDLKSNIPPSDLKLVAGTTQVIVRKNLSPGIIFMLLEAMTETHRAATSVSRDSEFPALRNTELPVDEHAKEYYQTGVPWVYRNLPLGLASVIGYYIVLIVPLLVLLPLCNWLGLPRMDEILVYLRSKVWLRTLHELEDSLIAGRPFVRTQYATFNLIRTSLHHPDLSSDCRALVQRIQDRLEKKAAPVELPTASEE